jgi:8-oxo-dGTP pyrophosphatase MutT (NUDIX family)
MSAVPALPAATVTLVRDVPRGLEVLMLQRNHQSGFMPGMFLFPGGALDAGDADPAVLTRCAGLNDEAASAALGIPSGGLRYWAAAIRESFEEAGVLLACDACGALVNPRTAERVGRFEEYRTRLNAGEEVLADLLQSEDLTLAVDRLTYFSHWITPVGAPRRYDTRFFVATAPHDQEALPDNVEAIHHVWVSPGSARSLSEWRIQNAHTYDTHTGAVRGVQHRRLAHCRAAGAAGHSRHASAHQSAWRAPAARRPRL